MSNLALRLIGLVGEGEDVAACPLEPLGDGGQLDAEPVHQHMHQHHPAALTELHAHSTHQQPSGQYGAEVQ
jgi:hypothetical protein